jgi:hypothetical protein
MVFPLYPWLCQYKYYTIGWGEARNMICGSASFAGFLTLLLLALFFFPLLAYAIDS